MDMRCRIQKNGRPADHLQRQRNPSMRHLFFLHSQNHRRDRCPLEFKDLAGKDHRILGEARYGNDYVL